MPAFTAKHISQTAAITLSVPPEQVFPLFGPVREAEWAEGWAIEPLHAQTELLEEEGAVFLTHLHGEPETVWLISRYEPHTHYIEYVRLTPGVRLTLVKIQCEAASGGATRATITYTITALAERGNEYIASFTEVYYQHMMKSWEQAINHRLKTGEVLNHPI